MEITKEVGTLKQKIATEMLLRKYAKMFSRDEDLEKDFLHRFSDHYEKDLWEKFDGEIDDYIEADPEMKAFYERMKKSVSMEDFEDDILEEINDSYGIREDEDENEEDPIAQINREIESQLNVEMRSDLEEEKEQALFHCSATMLMLYMARERAKVMGYESDFLTLASPCR
jgi:hypothetical protein